MTKRKRGVFPVRWETDQYEGLDGELRIYEICWSEVETDLHFLFRCPKLKYTRTAFVDAYQKTHPGFQSLSQFAKLKEWLQVTNIGEFAKWLKKMTDARREVLYK